MSGLMRALLALGLLLAPGGRTGSSATVMGATSLMPYARAVVATWATQHPGIRVALSGGGSYAGWYALTGGKVEIALSDLALGRPRDIKAQIIGKMPVLFVVNPGDGVSSVTRSDLAAMFQGRLRNWRALGGHRLPIRLVVRPYGSGARAVVGRALGAVEPSVLQIVQLSNGAVVRAVAETPGAIGYVEGARHWPGVVSLRIDRQTYQSAGARWPFYAWPRVYWRSNAPVWVESLAMGLATSQLRSQFGIIPERP